MPLPPSRKDFTGPPPRDVSDLAKITRHHGSALRRMDPGYLGGTRGTPSPVRGLTPSPLVGDDGGGDGVDDIQFLNTDRSTAFVDGRISLLLTYEPIEGSLHIRWNGLDQPPTEWTLDGQLVTFTNAHIRAGDTLTAAYAYIGEEAEPFDLIVRGTTRNTGALPVETVPGDFIIVAVRWGLGGTAVNYTDPRLTQLTVTPAEFKVWVGIATDLSPLSFTGPIEKAVVVAYVGGASVTGVSAASGASSATPTPLSGSASLLVAGQRSSVVPGGLDNIAAPWVLDENSGDAEFVQVRVYHWLDSTASTTPSVTATASIGGIDEVDAALITVVGLG